jgi:hypothetical protein
MKLSFTAKEFTVGRSITVVGYAKEKYVIKHPFPISYDLYLPDKKMLSFSSLESLKYTLLSKIEENKNGR